MYTVYIFLLNKIFPQDVFREHLSVRNLSSVEQGTRRDGPSQTIINIMFGWRKDDIANITSLFYSFFEAISYLRVKRAQTQVFFRKSETFSDILTMRPVYIYKKNGMRPFCPQQ